MRHEIKTVEIVKIDFNKNTKISYTISCEGLRVINNYKFNSLEIPTYVPIYAELVNEIKHIFSKEIKFIQGNSCIIFDNESIYVRYL